MPSTNKNLFNPKNIDNHANMLARHLPLGRVWSSGFDSNKYMGKLVRGLAWAYYHISILINKTKNELDINQTEELITEWEKSVGIPSSGIILDPDLTYSFPLIFPAQFTSEVKSFDPFTTNKSLADRREQIKQKLSNFGGVQTIADFVRISTVFGFNVNIFPGAEYNAANPGLYPNVFTSDKSTKHTIVVEFIDSLHTFPLDFPIVFSGEIPDFLRYLFAVLAPANVYTLII
jgi:uncharacterized protein YmfQ (DUF2313 family)